MTIWQPSYTPSGHALQGAKQRRKTRCDVGKTKNMVLSYLEKHGITEKQTMRKALAMTTSRINHGLQNLGDLIAYEHSGAGATRMCHYWAVSHPPRPEQRSKGHQAYLFFLAHPWAGGADLPDSIAAEPRQKHLITITLEKAGKLISRVEKTRKQYKAVI